jgi:ribonuclease J
MRKKKNIEKKMRIIPLGGLDGIGKNMTLFEYEDTILVVDCGIMFPSADMPGIDFLIPDFTYLKQNKQKVKGIVITHGHEDHIGAISFLFQELQVPIYATKLTLGLIKSRLEESSLKKKKVKFVEIKARDSVDIGCFSVEFIRVNHSIVDGVGLAITTPLGTIVHTGDFKIDFSPVDGKVTDFHHFAEQGEKGVLLLLSDSTNAERPGYTGSENVLNEKLIEIFSSAKGRIIVATFASNINRIQQVLDAAQRFNKKVVVSGRSMIHNIEISQSLGYLTFKEGLIVDLKEVKALPDKKIVIICTGTQGEPLSALTRIANGTHKHFACCKGDKVVITASVIPGNERTVSNVINALLKQEAEVYYEQGSKIHVSGHGSQEELKMMLALTKPKFFMPIHGEHKQLRAHAGLAESIRMKTSQIMIADNGDILELTRKSFEKVGQLPLTTVFVDSEVQGDLSSHIIRNRQAMASDGVVYLTVVLAEGMLIHPPVVSTKGFVGMRNGNIEELLLKEAEYKLHKILATKPSSNNVKVTLKKAIRSFIFKTTRRNPVIEVQVLGV